MLTTTVIHDVSFATDSKDSELLPSYSHTYHELSEQHVVEADVLVQLKANMAQLEDLHGRLKYMMGELSYLLRKS